MKKWEYMIVNEYAGPDRLNELGLQGWELVSITASFESYTARFYFKRELKGVA